MIVDSVNPTSFVVPKVSKASRDTMAAETGSLVFMTDDSRLYISTTNAVGSTSWQKIGTAV